MKGLDKHAKAPKVSAALYQQADRHNDQRNVNREKNPQEDGPRSKRRDELDFSAADH